jgi:hypothetical protein
MKDQGDSITGTPHGYFSCNFFGPFSSLVIVMATRLRHSFEGGERSDPFPTRVGLVAFQPHGFSRRVRHRRVIGPFGCTENSVAECSTKKKHRGPFCDLLQFPKLVQRATVCTVPTAIAFHIEQHIEALLNPNHMIS